MEEAGRKTPVNWDSNLKAEEFPPYLGGARVRIMTNETANPVTQKLSILRIHTVRWKGVDLDPKLCFVKGDIVKGNIWVPVLEYYMAAFNGPRTLGRNLLFVIKRPKGDKERI